MGGLGDLHQPRPGMRQVGFLTRSRSVKNVAVLGRENTAAKDRRFSRVRNSTCLIPGLP